MKMKKWFELSSVGFFAVGVFMAYSGEAMSAGYQRHQVLTERAKGIFFYDRMNPGELPANQLAALSVALAFHNDHGAYQIIQHLEPTVAKNSSIQKTSARE